MSVVGLDLGTRNAVIAVARNKGVDVIANEVSNRATPSLVAFARKARAIGESAKTQEMSNLKNTIGSLTRLAGRSFDDPDTAIEQEYVTAPLVNVNGQVGAQVTYLGKKEVFTAPQLIAMFLNKARETASKELRLPVGDMVIAVPAWYTDAQRRAILDAGDVAGLKILRLINETTATALSWGITKLDLPAAEEKPKRVAFVDIGYSNYACSIAEFKKGEVKIVGTAWDRHFGGRDFDKAIMEHFVKEFKAKYKIDIYSNPKAKLRVLTAAERLKKVLSSNSSGNMNIESVMDDVDVNGTLTRDELIELVAPLIARVQAPLEQALAEAKLKKEDIDQIELIGGCSRVPRLKQAIEEFFGRPLSYTLNADEAVARGCAFNCAILSPVFRVRDFSIQDIVGYPIEFTWEKSPEIPDEDTSLTVFTKGGQLPSTKILTFYRKQPFDLEAKYASADTLPGKINPWIGRFSVKGVKPDAKGDFMICKLKARLNLHGILNVEQAYYVEDEEVEEPEPEKKDGDAMDTDDKPAAAPVPKKKKQVRKGDLAVASGTASLDESIKSQYAEKELEMARADQNVLDTEEKKNELESEIYSLRSKIDSDYESGGYAEFASEPEKDKVRQKCDELEEWLYDDGSDATKAQYVAKMEELRASAGPIAQRYNDRRQEDEEAAAKIRAEEEAKRAAAEAEKKAAAEESARKLKEAKEAAEAREAAAKEAAAKEGKDEVMADGEAPAEVEEA